MLRRIACSPCVHQGPLVYGLPTRSTRPSAVPARRWTYLQPTNLTTCTSKRAISTRHNDSNTTQKAAASSGPTEKDLSAGSRDAQKDVNAAPKDDSKSNFTITPRFQWRWRWAYPKDNGTDIRKSKKRGTILKSENQAEHTDSSHFLPVRDEQAQDELESVIGSISKLAEDLQAPLSPLEKGLEGKEWIPKRQPTKKEKMQLSYNPWAVMLAGRMRLDTAAKVRLPEPLLLTLGEVASPAGDSTYLLPDDLANLEAYDKRLQTALRRQAMTDLFRERGGSSIKILPYKLLVEELTEELVSWDNSTKSGRTKSGSIAKRLLPTRWMERTQRINAYQSASKEYWNLKEKEGGLDDKFFQKPEKPLDVSQLQWQPNIGERITSIMRQRLILAIDHLGRKTDEPRDRPWRHFMYFKWPESLYIDVVAASRAPSVLPDTDDKTDATFSLPAQHYKLREEPTTSQNESVVGQTWTPDSSTYHFNEPDIWLPGSYFLHMGPPETTLTALPRTQQDIPTTTEQDQDEAQSQSQSTHPPNKFIPPMLSVNNNLRLPVFNVPALLGPKFDHPLHQILTRHAMVPPSSNTIHNDHPPTTTTNYLILIRGTAPGSHYILHDLWQLWRYLGGTDSLLASESAAESESEIPPDAQGHSRSEVRRQKDQIKRYKMSKKVWDSLYAFLPGVERRPGGE